MLYNRGIFLQRFKAQREVVRPTRLVGKNFLKDKWTSEMIDDICCPRWKLTSYLNFEKQRMVSDFPPRKFKIPKRGTTTIASSGTPQPVLSTFLPLDKLKVPYTLLLMVVTTWYGNYSVKFLNKCIFEQWITLNLFNWDELDSRISFQLERFFNRSL